MTTTYRYELRRGDEIVATGHITEDTRLEVGDSIALGSARGTVRDVGPTLRSGEVRLVVQLGPESRPPA